MKLYEMANEFKGLLDMVEDGQLTQDDIQDTLEAMQIDFKEKQRIA